MPQGTPPPPQEMCGFYQGGESSLSENPTQVTEEKVKQPHPEAGNARCV